MISAVSKPHGWKNTKNLLEDLLYAFGWEPEKLKVDPATPRMFGEVPADPEIRAVEYQRELAEVDPLAAGAGEACRAAAGLAPPQAGRLRSRVALCHRDVEPGDSRLGLARYDAAL